MSNEMTSPTLAPNWREEYEDICDAMIRDQDGVVSECGDDEYRDERDDSLRLADRHGC